MSPEKFLKFAKTDCASFAAYIGVAPSTVWRAVKGKAKPTYKMMIEFHVHSGGKVGLDDWRALYPIKVKGKPYGQKASANERVR